MEEEASADVERLGASLLDGPYLRTCTPLCWSWSSGGCLSTGGNTGMQITTTLAYAIATGDVQHGDVLRVLRTEWSVTVVLASAMTAANDIRACTLTVGSNVGLVVAVAAAWIVVWPTAVASLLPSVLKRPRLDPAVGSGPLITTVVDGTGLVICLQLARWLLGLG